MLTRMRMSIIEHGRATEWTTSAVMMSFAVILWMPGDTFGSPGYRGFVAVGITEATAAWPLFFIGATRCVALYINGSWRRTPVLRMIGAILGAGLFLMLASLFLGPTMVFAPSTGNGFSGAHAASLALSLGLVWLFRRCARIDHRLDRIAARTVTASLLVAVGAYLVSETFDYGAPPSTGIAAYLVLALTDTLSAYRSAADAWMARRLAAV